MARLNPYLNFDNNCREAMNFYKECLGGELFLQTVSELPAMAAQMPPQMKDNILHSSLTSGDIVIMASDLNPEKRIEGNTVHLCINCNNENELNSFILLENEKLYTKSTGALRVTKKLSGLWPLLYGFIIIPPFIRNAVYSYIAHHRYKWFGKKEACWIPTPELKQLFLD